MSQRSSSHKMEKETKFITRMRPLASIDVAKEGYTTEMAPMSTFGAMKSTVSRTSQSSQTKSSKQQTTAHTFPSGFAIPSQTNAEVGNQPINLGPNFKFTACFAGSLDDGDDAWDQGENVRGKPGATSLGPVISVAHVQSQREGNFMYHEHWQHSSITSPKSYTNDRLEDPIILSNGRVQRSHSNWVLDDNYQASDGSRSSNIAFAENITKKAKSTTTKPPPQNNPLPEEVTEVVTEAPPVVTPPATYSCGSTLAAYNLTRSHRPYTGEPTPPVLSSPRYVSQRQPGSGTPHNLYSQDPTLRTLKPPTRESKTPEFPMAITSLNLRGGRQREHTWDRDDQDLGDMQSFSQFSISTSSQFHDHFAQPHHQQEYDGSLNKQTLTSNFFSEEQKKQHAREHLQQYHPKKKISSPVEALQAEVGPNVHKMAKSAQIFKTRLTDSTVNIKKRQSMAHAYSLLPQRPPPITPSFGARPQSKSKQQPLR